MAAAPVPLERGGSWACWREAEKGATSSLKGMGGGFVQGERIRRPCPGARRGELTCGGKGSFGALEHSAKLLSAITTVLFIPVFAGESENNHHPILNVCYFRTENLSPPPLTITRRERM